MGTGWSDGEDERGPGPVEALAKMLPGAVADAVVAAMASRLPDEARLDVTRSEGQGELVKALCRARPNFGTVEKSRTAKITPREGKGAPYTYSYSTLSDAIAATVDSLAAEELAVFQDFGQEPGEIVIFTEMHHGSGQWRRSKLSMPVARDAGPQGIGSAITYGRRYSYFAILNLAPEDDDDGQAAQRGKDREGESVASAAPLAALVPVAAYALVRQEIAAAAGAKAISEAQVNRLYAIAGNNEWTRKEVDGACAKLLVTEPAKIPWKAYDRVCELFGAFGPEQVRRKSAADTPTTDVTPQPEPDLHEELTPWGAEPKSVQPAPAPPPPADPLPEWGEVWQKIRTGYDDLTPEDAAAHVDRKSVEAILEGFGRGGWTPDQIEGILRAELGITPYQLPKDGTNPPAYRMIAKAFRIFKPAHVSAEDAERYGFQAVTAGPSVGDILQEHNLASFEMPETAEEAWRPIRAAIEAIGAAHPEALVPISPDDRLTLIGRKDRNGNRSSGDVAALVAHHLGVQVEKLPAVVFEPALRVLAAFPSRGPGREELLGKLPADPSKIRVKDLGVVLQQLLRDGVLTDEEVPRSGQGNTVSKDDMTGVIERLRERALLEAGRHE